MNVFRVFVNELFYVSFDTTFMKNIRSCQKINIFFIKKFLKNFLIFFI